MSTPLVFVGSYFGFKRETISAPVRTNQIGNVDAIYVDAIHSKGLFELPFELPLTFIPPFYLPLTAHTPSHNTPSHMLLLTSYQYTLSSLTSYEHPPPPPLSTARHIPDQVWYTNPVFSVALGGILPFGAVCIELFFVMSALWLHQVCVTQTHTLEDTSC